MSMKHIQVTRGCLLTISDGKKANNHIQVFIKNEDNEIHVQAKYHFSAVCI